MVYRSVVGGPVQRIPDLDLLCLVDDFLEEDLAEGLLDKDPARADPVLALVEEHGTDHATDGLVKVAVWKRKRKNFEAKKDYQKPFSLQAYKYKAETLLFRK